MKGYGGQLGIAGASVGSSVVGFSVTGGNEGRLVPVPLGKAVGKTVGRTVGRTVGSSVGASEGTSVGLNVGRAVEVIGAADISTGARVGMLVGNTVGNEVGDKVVGVFVSGTTESNKSEITNGDNLRKNNKYNKKTYKDSKFPLEE